MLGISLASCNTSSVSKGTIQGIFYGGVKGQTAADHHVVPTSGLITISGMGNLYTGYVNMDGRFSIAVLPGTYKISGQVKRQSGQGTACVASVHVASGHVSHVNIHCVFH